MVVVIEYGCASYPGHGIKPINGRKGIDEASKVIGINLIIQPQGVAKQEGQFRLCCFREGGDADTFARVVIAILTIIQVSPDLLCEVLIL